MTGERGGGECADIILLIYSKLSTHRTYIYIYSKLRPTDGIGKINHSNRFIKLFRLKESFSHELIMNL